MSPPNNSVLTKNSIFSPPEETLASTETMPPVLLDDLIEEIFLRLPPDEPACLVRASLASMFWLGFLSGPRFHRRYSEFHGAPPMLGFLYDWPQEYSGPEWEDPVPHFFSTKKFGGRISDDYIDHWADSEYTARDCRHGRVLLDDTRHSMGLVVWNPMMGTRRSVWNVPGDFNSHGMAVLCAVRGCDHRTCDKGPFRVVFVAINKIDGGCVAYEYAYSSKNYKWSKLCYSLDQLTGDAFIEPMPPVLVDDALHFMLTYEDDGHLGIIKYDVGSKCLSLLDAPLAEAVIGGATILMATEGGSLGFAHVDMLTLYLWSRQMGPDGVASWAQCRVIDLNNLLPIQNTEERLKLIGSVEGSGIIFVTMDLGIYEINLQTLRWKKLWKREEFCVLIPYMSFYRPPEWVVEPL